MYIADLHINLPGLAVLLVDGADLLGELPWVQEMYRERLLDMMG